MDTRAGFVHRSAPEEGGPDGKGCRIGAANPAGLATGLRLVSEQIDANHFDRINRSRPWNMMAFLQTRARGGDAREQDQQFKLSERQDKSGIRSPRKRQKSGQLAPERVCRE